MSAQDAAIEQLALAHGRLLVSRPDALDNDAVRVATPQGESWRVGVGGNVTSKPPDQHAIGKFIDQDREDASMYEYCPAAGGPHELTADHTECAACGAPRPTPEPMAP